MRVEGTGFLGRNCCYAALAGCGVSARLAGGTLKTQKDSKQGEGQSAIEPCSGQFSLNPIFWDFESYENNPVTASVFQKKHHIKIMAVLFIPKGD